jgi:hypothetical protein
MSRSSFFEGRQVQDSFKIPTSHHQRQKSPKTKAKDKKARVHQSSIKAHNQRTFYSLEFYMGKKVSIVKYFMSFCIHFVLAKWIE